MTGIEPTITVNPKWWAVSLNFVARKTKIIIVAFFVFLAWAIPQIPNWLTPLGVSLPKVTLGQSFNAVSEPVQNKAEQHTTSESDIKSTQPSKKIP